VHNPVYHTAYALENLWSVDQNHSLERKKVSMPRAMTVQAATK
jgi:hypothetical protein